MVKRALEAQSAVVQDVERNSKIMQQVIDFFDPEAVLKRERAYKEQLDRDRQAMADEMSKMRQDMERQDRDRQARDAAMRQELAATSRYLSHLITHYEEANEQLKQANVMVVDSNRTLEGTNKILEEAKDEWVKLRRENEDLRRQLARSSPGDPPTTGANPDGASPDQP